MYYWRGLLLKESIADVVVRQHYEHFFFLPRIHFPTRPSWFKDKWLAKLRVVAKSINIQVSHRNESWSKKNGWFHKRIWSTRIQIVEVVTIGTQRETKSHCLVTVLISTREITLYTRVNAISHKCLYQWPNKH